MAEVSCDWGSERPARSGIRTTPRLARLRQACAMKAARLANADLRFRAALVERETEVDLEDSSTRDPL